jgi:hypothetical protein
VTDIDAPSKPITFTKLRRGDDPNPLRWKRRPNFGPARTPHFRVREDPAPPQITQVYCIGMNDAIRAET